MYLSPLLTLLFFISLGNSSSNTIYFDVIRNEKIIGKLVATKSENNGLITYKSTTQIDALFLAKIRVFYQFVVTMDDNHLNSSDALIVANGKIRNHTRIKWDDNKYHIQRKNKRTQWLNTSIDFPAILLLFQEPIDIESPFSEKTGDFHRLYSMGNHSYKKVNSKGKENWYYYENGMLQCAEINAGIIQFELVLRD